MSIKSEGENSDWFLSGIACCLGSGKHIKFWHNKWCGGVPFKLLFPEAFIMALNQDMTVK